MDSEIVCFFQTLNHTRKQWPGENWNPQPLGNVMLKNAMIDGIGAQSL